MKSALCCFLIYFAILSNVAESAIIREPPCNSNLFPKMVFLHDYECFKGINRHQNILITEIQKYLTSNNFPDVVTVYDKLNSEYSPCMERINNYPVDSCLLTKTYRDIRNETYYSIVKYMFEDNARRTVEFINGGNLDCFKKEEVKIDRYLTNHINNFTSELCKDLENFQEYVVNLSKEKCPNGVNYVSDVTGLLYSGICKLEAAVRNKDALKPVLSFLASLNTAYVSPTKDRKTREIGGPTSKLPHIENKLKKFCTDSTLDVKLVNMKVCIKVKPLFVTPRDEFIQQIETCSKDARELLKKCLPEKLRYFPDFFIKLVESVVKFLYDDLDVITRGLSPCLEKLEKPESKIIYDLCIGEVISGHDDDLPDSKKKFCEKFLPIGRCFVKQVNQTCTRTDDLEKFNRDYFAAMERPCK